jgi:hypothetical protein
MSGPDLARELTRERPGLKVLFTTGFAFSAMEDGGAPRTVLHKPFKQSALLAEVRRLVAG